MNSPRPPLGPHRFLPWLILLFLGSGCAALIYEVIWLQLLQLIIGLTSVSLGVLLGAFMGGMCLGSWLLPRCVSSRPHPLRVYAILEIGIALIGLAIPFIAPALAEFYTDIAGAGFRGIAGRALLAAICLLPPTILMGATLPAIARWVESSRQGAAWLGVFYGGNILGAVLGCLLAGFYLLRVHDMTVATLVAAGLNLLVASLAWVWASRTPRSLSISGPEEPPLESARETSPSPGEDRTAPSLSAAIPAALPPPKSWPVYAAIALSGMAALGAEVVWTRLLSLMMGGTVYTFSIILAVFLTGLGIGSSAGSFWGRAVSNPRAALAACQFLLMAAIAWAAFMIARSLPYWPINPTLSLSPWFNFQLDIARCLWAILPASILWGASFPLALASLASRGQDPGRLVGGLYAANTVGAIAGALAFSVVLIPAIGTQRAQQTLIGLAGLASLLALAPRWKTTLAQTEAPPVHPFSNFGRNLAVCLAVAVAFMAMVPAIPWGLAAYGRFMPTYGDRFAPGLVSEEDIPLQGGKADIFCTYLGEGLNGTVAVTKWRSGARNFHSAGKVQASSDPADMRLQRMLGHISALAHPKPESVLVVACGAGVTAGAFVAHPEVKRIVICDIEPLVPAKVAPLFHEENFGVVTDPRTQIISDDGRHFIRTTQEKFDIITSDPIDPWVKGCAALNTVEYYEMCKARLKPGGVMSLWIPLYESNRETVRSVVATFFKVFPNGIFWSNDTDGEGYDAVLFGQAEPTQIDLDALQARWEKPDHARVKRSLADAGFLSPLDLLATYAGRAEDLQPYLRGAEINTDRNLRLQYLAGMAVNSFVGPEILNEITLYQRFPESLFLGSESARQTLRNRIEKNAARGASPAAAQ